MHSHHLHMFFGRRGHQGGFGRFGGGFMAGDMGGRGFGMGRKLASADLQLLVLKLLDERPSYGYELIKELELRSKGFYVPSPGMIYPAMTYLEEIGHATVQVEGNRKRYAITATGKAHLQENSATVEALMTQFGRIGERMERLRRAFDAGESDPIEPGRGALKELRHALHALRESLHEKFGSEQAEQQRIAEVLKRAAEEIRKG